MHTDNSIWFGINWFLFLLLQLLKWCACVVELRWKRTDEREGEPEKNEKRKTKSILLTRENNWNVNNFCVCYLHFVHVRTTKHYFGWSLALNARTNVEQTTAKILEIMRLLYVRSTCRFFEMWFNHIEKIQFRTRLRSLSNFPIFRHQCRLLACFSFVVIVVCVRLHKSIKNYVRFCRNFVPTFVKMSSERQKTDSILLSFFFHCLWHHPSNLRCEYATICFFVTLRCVSHRVRLSAEIQSAPNFVLLKNQPIGCVFA